MPAASATFKSQGKSWNPPQPHLMERQMKDNDYKSGASNPLPPGVASPWFPMPQSTANRVGGFAPDDRAAAGGKSPAGGPIVRQPKA
jgi:hypothetical protein